ncbi:MAG: F0F1 ATP synthase subunit A [Planctomycetales bacterium]
MFASSGDVFHHIRDARNLELPRFIISSGHTADFPTILGLPLTKFMILQVIAGLLTLFIFMGLSWHIRKGNHSKGKFWNFWEAIALFVRDNVVRPAIGTGHHHGHDDHGHGGHDHHGHEHGHHHEHGHDQAHAPVAAVDASHPADKYLPFIWTCFFYVLFCNLLGALPWLGSPTGNLAVTGALAFAVFIMVVISVSRELGAVGFWQRLVPSLDVPNWIKPVLIPLLYVVEVAGLLIKHGVLAMRLFANIMAGHTVIGMILGFIAMATGALFYVVTPASILGQVGIGLLELFVAFLQAYVFAFLASLFIGTAVHPH